MTDVPPTLSYASPVSGSCPLCQSRPVTVKAIYGHPVCKKCYYKFANRRQLGYLVDGLVFILPNIIILRIASAAMVAAHVSEGQAKVAGFFIGLSLAIVFCLRDSIGGRSPGKWATNTQAVNEITHQPISFGDSLKRNSILLIGQIPIVGLIVIVPVLIMAFQVGSGYRLGDRFAKTKVIWLKYAHLPMFSGSSLA